MDLSKSKANAKEDRRVFLFLSWALRRPRNVNITLLRNSSKLVSPKKDELLTKGWRNAHKRALMLAGKGLSRRIKGKGKKEDQR